MKTIGRVGVAAILFSVLAVGAWPEGTAATPTAAASPAASSKVSNVKAAASHDRSGHEDAEGLKLVADTHESVRRGS